MKHMCHMDDVGVANYQIECYGLFTSGYAHIACDDRAQITRPMHMSSGSTVTIKVWYSYHL